MSKTALTDSPHTLATFPHRVRAYCRADAQYDALAGLTVAIMGVPQSMAYALIAGVPPIWGLYTSIITCVVGALFGSSRHLITGPTNATCMVLFSVSAPYIQQGSAAEVVLLVSLMAGVVKLLFGLLRLGSIVRYVSNSVVVGFTAGAGILIAGNQLHNTLGVEINASQTRHFYQVLAATVQKVGQANPYALGVAIFTALAVVVAPRVNRKIPGALLGVTVSGLIVYLMGWHDHGVVILSDEALIQRDLALFYCPALLLGLSFSDLFDMLHNLSGGAVAVAILGSIEAASSSRAVAASSGQRLDFSREFRAQGLANIAGAFFLNFAGSGSFTRTALNFKSGGRTRMAAVFSAAFTTLTILALAPLANHIPKASLAGMLIVIAYGMIEKHRLSLALRSGGESRAVMFATLFATLLLPLQYAIFIGVFLSIAFLLNITSKTDLTLLTPREDGHFDEVPFGEKIDSPVVLVNMEGDLYFAAVENLDYELRQALTTRTRVVLLRMKRLRAVGSTAMAILEHFWKTMREQDIHLVVCGIEKNLEGLMTRSGLRERIGEQNLFYADQTLFQSTSLALARARAIVDMEKLRATPAATAMAATDVEPVETSRRTARDMMSRRCVRFGVGHSMREAVWLLSEMNKRQARQEALPLFLQDKSGKLVGQLSPRALLEAMGEGLDLERAEAMGDEEIAEHFRRRFDDSIGQLAATDMPVCSMETGLGALLRESVRRDQRTLPIRDDGGRVIGMVNVMDLLQGVGRALGVQKIDASTITQPGASAK